MTTETAEWRRRALTAERQTHALMEAVVGALCETATGTAALNTLRVPPSPVAVSPEGVLALAHAAQGVSSELEHLRDLCRGALSCIDGGRWGMGETADLIIKLRDAVK